MSSVDSSLIVESRDPVVACGVAPSTGALGALLCPEPRAGFASAGSLGVRGFISEVRGACHDDRVYAVRDALQVLRVRGIRRVHTIVHAGDELETAAVAAGFSACAGETLFRRALAQPPGTNGYLPSSFVLRNGTLHDLLKIGNELTHVPELAFQGWEKLLIGKELQRPDRFFKLVEHDDRVVGISIGGAHGELGTISHTWVAPEHRKQKLGQALSDSSLDALYQAGARVVHLMTTADNRSAECFWERQGFLRDSSTYFLEVDI